MTSRNTIPTAEEDYLEVDDRIPDRTTFVSHSYLRGRPPTKGILLISSFHDTDLWRC